MRYAPGVATTFDQELSRLARSAGRAVAARRARVAVLGGLFALAVTVLAHRLVGDVPFVGLVEGRPLRALATVVGAGALALLAGRAVGLFARPPARTLARRLDDELGLADSSDAALSAGSLVDPFVGAVARRAATALAQVDGRRFGSGELPGRRLPVALLALTLFLLLAPGVLGLGGSSGAGAGTESGVGRRDEPEEPRRADALTPDEADRWLIRHGRVHLDVPEAKKPLEWRVRLLTDAEAPASLEGALAAVIDGAAPIATGRTLSAPPGVCANAVQDFDAEKVEPLDAALTPGKHTVRVRWTPTAPPFRVSLDSNEIEIDVPPPQPSPSAHHPDDSRDPRPSAPPPTPPPPQEPPPTAPPPPPPSQNPRPPGEGDPAPKPPEATFHDEVVEPLAKEGATVRKPKALVAVRDEHAGAIAPRLVPVTEVLKDVDRVAERAVSEERVSPSDRAFLVRYLEALRRAAGGK